MLFSAIMATTAILTANGPDVLASQAATAEQLDVTDLGEVEVKRRRLENKARAFVQEATAPPPGRPLARWHRSVCIGAGNMTPQYAQFLIDRVATVAVDVGLRVEAPGCRPDIMILAASDAEALAKALVADEPHSFRPSPTATDRGTAALERFQTTDAPVRWWHVSLPVEVDTGQLAVTVSGALTIPGPGGPLPLMMRVRDASRLRANTRDDLARVTVIVDVNKVGLIGFGALSDYIAMVSLAQINPDTDMSPYDTVLNLFSEGADRLAGMTAWDRDYLRSLYNARRDYARSTQQEREIVRAMTNDHQLRGTEDDDER